MTAPIPLGAKITETDAEDKEAETDQRVDITSVNDGVNYIHDADAVKEIIANAEIIRKTLCVTDALHEEKGKLEEEMAVFVEMTQNIVAENARVAQDQDEYQKRYDGLVQRYDMGLKNGAICVTINCTDNVIYFKTDRRGGS